MADLTTEEKASLWDALISCERLRVIGFAKLGQRGQQHIGIELWDEFPKHLDDSRDRENFQLFVTTVAALPALPVSDAGSS